MGIASLTKIMTCHLVVQLAKMDSAILDEWLVVSQRAAAIVGTSAKLLAGDTLRVREALYGLMLPSGNDAALALAEHFGDRMLRRRQQARRLGRTKATPRASHLRMRLPPAGKEERREREGADSVPLFVADMNAAAQSLGLRASSFTNPHGLSAPLHQSSAEDVALLCQTAMADALFAEIVATTERTAEVHNAGDGSSRRVSWRNTNELLHEGFCGIKTGTTPTTGFCLASEFRVRGRGSAAARGASEEEGGAEARVAAEHGGRERRLVVVVLASATKAERTNDTRALVQWAADAMHQQPSPA